VVEILLWQEAQVWSEHASLICDADRRFLDINIGHPASTNLIILHLFVTNQALLSDTVVEGEVPFLAPPGLCLFGITPM
jgi:hypothetical protein